MAQNTDWDKGAFSAPQNKPVDWKTGQFSAQSDTSRSTGQPIKDVGLGLAEGVTGLVKSAGDAYGLVTGDMDNAVSKAAGGWQESLDKEKSAGFQARTVRRKDNIGAQDSRCSNLPRRLALFHPGEGIGHGCIAPTAPLPVPQHSAGAQDQSRQLQPRAPGGRATRRGLHHAGRRALFALLGQ